MARTKNFESMNLLEKVDYLVKKQVPKNCVLQQTSLVISYWLTINVATEDNPFELTSKTYEVIATYKDEVVDVVIKDGNKIIKNIKTSYQDELNDN